MKPETIPTDWATTAAAQRRMMVECQVRTFGVTDHAVIAAMLEIPREIFVAPDVAALSYSDGILASAGGKRHLLAPMVLARLLQAADLRAGDHALDVAGGCGYSAAILSRLVARVTALETTDGMTATARSLLPSVGATQVAFVTAALETGAAIAAPFDVILINGAIEVRPQTLLDQLADGGRLLAIDAARGAPKAVRYERAGRDISVRPLFDATAPWLDGFRKTALRNPPVSHFCSTLRLCRKSRVIVAAATRISR